MSTHNSIEYRRAEYLAMINNSVHILIDSPNIGWVILEDDSGCWRNLHDTDTHAINIIIHMKKFDLSMYCDLLLISKSHPEGTVYILIKNN